jgi:hypothetical protein
MEEKSRVSILNLPPDYECRKYFLKETRDRIKQFSEHLHYHTRFKKPTIKVDSIQILTIWLYRHVHVTDAESSTLN